MKKNLYSILFSCLCACLCISLQAQAALDIELTQGLSGAVPIAVIPFEGQQSARHVGDSLSGIISTDLKNSGRFTLLSNNQVKQFPTVGEDVHINFWRKRNVDYVIVGKVTPTQDNRFQISVDLVEMYPQQMTTRKAGQNQSGELKHIVLRKRYTIGHNGFRKVGHKISDDIYQYLTGEPGIFSTRIAYVLMKHRYNKPYEYQLQVADFDGHNANALLTSKEPIMSPTWAPDGRRLAYVSFEGDRSEVFVQSVDSGVRDRIASFKGINSAPAWSPDGRKMALVLSKSGAPKIYIMDIASKRLTQLTDGLSIDTEPVWMPDGQSLLFTSNRGGGPQIYRISLATKRVERITYDGRYNASVDISQDGKKITYLHMEGNHYTIAAQDMTTGQMRVLTKTNSGLDESPSISPNGRMILYATHDRNQGILGLVSVDGRIRLRLPTHDGNVQEPAWSPYIS